MADALTLTAPVLAVAIGAPVVTLSLVVAYALLWRQRRGRVWRHTGRGFAVLAVMLTLHHGAGLSALLAYLCLSIVLGLLARPPGEKRRFVDGLALVLALALLAPPSLPLALALYLCLFDLRFHRTRGLVLVPVVVLAAWGPAPLSVALGTAIGIAARTLTGRAGRPRLRGGSGPIQNAVAHFYRLLMGIYYRRVEAAGLANVPAQGPVLIVANHANAFIDGGMVAACLPRQVTLTARASLSQKPLNRVLLEALGIIQLHRAQDKGSDMSANRTALAGAIERLAEGGVLCLFPEGQSNTDPAMRRFRSGAARIALAYGERAAAESLPDLTIIPAGLLYDDKSRLRSTALVEFGAPISLRQWLAEQGDKASPRALSETFFKAIAALVPQYARQRDARRLPYLADLAARGVRPPQPQGHPESRLLRAWQWRRRLSLADAGPVLSDAMALRREARRHGIATEDLLVALSRWRATLFALREIELLLVGLAPALWGALNYLPSLLALCYEARRAPRLEDQWATHFIIPALIVLPFFALVQTALVATLVSPLAATLYLATLPYFARVSLHYGDRARASWRRARSYLRLVSLPDSERQRLRQALREVVASCRGNLLGRSN